MQTTYIETDSITIDSSISTSAPAAAPEEKVTGSAKPFEGEKIILLDGPVIRCVGRGSYTMDTTELDLAISRMNEAVDTAIIGILNEIAASVTTSFEE